MPSVSIDLHIPTYMHKFLTTHIGHPYKIRTNEHVISRFLLRNLSGKMMVYNHGDADKPTRYTTAPFTIIVPPMLNNQKWAWTVSPELEREFIKEVDALLEHTLITHIQVYQEVEMLLDEVAPDGLNYKRMMSKTSAINNFLKKHGITEQDISLDAILKRYQRSQAKQ